MATVVGLSGSLRKGSYNASLLAAAKELAPPGLTVEIQSIAGVPLYNADVEKEGVPPAVALLKERIAAAQGLLLVTPEYNHGIPGVFKNAIDWISRPPKDNARIWGGKPVFVIGATPGGGGTRFSQTAWLPVLSTLGMIQWHGELYVAKAGEVFDADGKLVDEKIKKMLAERMAGYAAFVNGLVKQ